MAGQDTLANMASDVRREAWAGLVPAVFTLAAEEVTTMQPPPVYHLNIPRQTLLAFVTGRVREHFLPYAPPLGSGEPWFEHEGRPLRWHVPAGVLYDLHVNLHATDAAGGSLPWALTVRFQGTPEERALMANGSREAAEAALLNALKESCHLRCGSALPAMNLSAAAQRRLVHALEVNDFDEFAEAEGAVRKGSAEPLRGVPVRQGRRAAQMPLVGSYPWGGAGRGSMGRGGVVGGVRGEGTGRERAGSETQTRWGSCRPRTCVCTPRHRLATASPPPRHRLATRLATASPPPRHRLATASWPQVRVYTSPTSWRQLPLRAAAAEGDAPRLLRHALAEMLPSHYGAEAPAPPPRALVQGVAVPLDTSLLWLWDACAHPDGWLYVCCELPAAAGGA